MHSQKKVGVRVTVRVRVRVMARLRVRTFSVYVLSMCWGVALHPCCTARLFGGRPNTLCNIKHGMASPFVNKQKGKGIVGARMRGL
jgi:hypothetical protein